jgi:NDP-sugar pyrophosphorylase family protein
MILAAGFGSRLAQGTADLPKPLAHAGGKPMIAWAIEALRQAGCTDLVVNLHHRATQIEEYLLSSAVPLPVCMVYENEILGTGGGVLNAKTHFDGAEAFILYNADIFTKQDLRPMVEAHARGAAFATLMVNQRQTSRALLFDEALHLLGKEQWKDEGMTFPETAVRRGFCGIHVISAEFFQLGYPQGVSDIFDIYRLALEQDREIRAFETTAYWTDLGTPQRIASFENWLEQQPGQRGERQES